MNRTRSFFKRLVTVTTAAAVLALGLPVDSLRAQSLPVPEGEPPQQTRSVQITFADMGFQDEQAARAEAGISYFLPIPQAWQRPGELTLHLVISHSPLLLPHRSNLTVIFNDVPLTTVPLDSGNADHATLTVPLPLDSPRPRSYHLRLIFYMRVSEDPCKDLHSPALWSVVHETSWLEFTYPLPAQPNDLAFYPYPLFPTTAVVPSPVYFVLPEQPDPADLEAAGLVAAKLGQLAATDLLSISVGPLTEVPVGSSTVIIGRPMAQSAIASLEQYLPLPLLADRQGFMDAGGAPILPDWGVIQLLSAPWDEETAILVVSGGNEEGLRRAGQALANQAALDLLGGNYALIQAAPRDAGLYPIAGQVSEKTTLRELTRHDEDWVVKGHSIQSVHYSFYLPPDWQMENSGYLDLEWAHSPVLWAERSMVDVFLNGTLLKSVACTPENADRNTLRVQLPAARLRPGYNTIAVRFTLRLKLEYCVHEYGEEAWGVIYGDSLLFLPHQEHPRRFTPDLGDFPYPFNDRPDLGDVILAIPSQPTPAELDGALEIAARLGRAARGRTLSIRLLPADHLAEEDRASHHLIVIGELGRNPLQDEVTRDLTVVGWTWKGLSAGGQPVVIERDGAPIGVIEEQVSPWNETRALLLVSANTPETLRLACGALGYAETSQELAGNIVIVTPDGLEGGLVTVFETLPTPTPQPAIPEEVPIVPAPLTWFFAGLTIIVVTLLLLVLFAEHRRRARKRKTQRGNRAHVPDRR